ncbi:MAG: hypothetical protein IJP96_13285 [Synergistaceae bacterium]|nr:hypothetical protein [Synergistaceae bacterium]MBQ6738538.1 hypothetical protein [Synergistaceae bacterium]MBR0076714.1 hypothetical protein [Synergistaceae bacterium]MBR0079800.1 hypothetical protein [Synergistaceae bacterium]
MVILGIIAVLIVLIGPFCIDPDHAFGYLALTLILAVAFPPAVAVLFILDVIAIIGWFFGAPKRRKFKDRMEAERERERELAHWRAEEREYQEYKKKHLW